MQRIIIVLIALFSLVASNAQAETVSVDGFIMSFGITTPLRIVGDTTSLTWKLEPDGIVKNEVASVNVYLYPSLELTNLRSTGDVTCTPVDTGFTCRAVGLSVISFIAADVEVIAPVANDGVMATAIVAVFRGGMAQHSVTVSEPSALPVETEPKLFTTFIPYMSNQ
ncbi:MAG TPA: hypothetical protein VLA24_17960 [Pseudomonadales bacterium]|nr:hypothetical protein [Pseudomonadales bacterium]